MIFRRKQKPPPIYADLLLEIDGQQTRIDVEQPGWLKTYDSVLCRASRIGLALRGRRKANLWIDTNGTKPEYISRVIGRIEMGGGGHVSTRVAGLNCGQVWAWLYRDGLVEIGSEPTLRDV
jgi:hypothetical protein